MWVQLAHRAFSSGASANKVVPDKENQNMVVASPSDKRNDDGDDASGIVHLVNPSMNELIRSLHSANQRPIIISEARIQGGRNSFKAIDNELMFVDDESKPDSSSLMSLQDSSNSDFSMSSQEINPYDVIPKNKQRTQSLDDLHLIGDDEDSTEDSSSSAESLMWRVHSEGALITMPGDGNLGKQMAYLKPAFDKILNGAAIQKARLRKKFYADFISKEPNVASVLPPNSANLCYWITMAHILAAIACHRWGI